jgi:hypothetical protein
MIVSSDVAVIRWWGAYLVSTCIARHGREALGTWVDIAVLEVLGQSVMQQWWDTTVITFTTWPLAPALPRVSSGS